MTNWANISSLAGAGSTFVLAAATFASVRSGNRSARTADRAARAVISQFTLRQVEDESWMASVVRHFNIDRPDPR